MVNEFMPRRSRVAPKKKQPVESVHDRDRIIVRLPDGMRDRLAAFAEANGRSMTAEVVTAIEEHLRGATRITQLWDFFERHRQDIEDISGIDSDIDELEYAVGRLNPEFRGLRELEKRRARWALEAAAREAARPPVTAEQAMQIRARIKETGADEAELLRRLKASSVEEIRNFETAVAILQFMRIPPKQPE
jgi:hypothetical protein